MFEPLTTFTKAAYFLVVVILASRNIGIDRSDMVGYYTGWHGLPRVVKILLVNLAVVASVVVCCLVLVLVFTRELQRYLAHRLINMFWVVSLALVMEVFMELTYFMGVVTIDRKVDLDGATAILWWKYKLLRVRSNSNLVIPLGVLLMIGVLSHWTVVMPEKTAVIITQSNTYIYYVEYLLLVVFIVAVVALVVPAKTQPVEFAEEKSYNTIVMDTSSDILRITTNPKTSSIVTTLLDHRVLYWTPQGNSEPIPIPCRMWPVSHVGLNDDGSMVVLVSTRQGVIQGYDKRELKWTLSVHFRGKVLESFFRRRTVPGFLARKMIRKRRGSDASMSSVNSLINANFPPPIQMKSFGQKQRERTSREEFVMVMDSGEILVVSCNDGKVQSYDVKQQLVCAIKIRTPRVMDRIVVQTKELDIIVVNIVNNSMKSRKLEVAPLKLCGIFPVEFVGFFIRVDGLECQLIDVNTGVVIKLFGVGNMKVNSLRVSYPEPLHCRFCGSAAISSFSVVYEIEGVVVVHTFRVDKKAICLRVERDPREIRCVGFGGAEEKVNWYENVVGYEVTSVNLMIGVVQKSSGLRNRKVKQAKEYELMVVSLGSGKAEYYEYKVDGVLWGVERYGHKSVILNQGRRMEVVYVGNSKLVD